MTCNEVKNILLTASQSEIESIAEISFAEHLSNCPNCRKYYSAISILEQSRQNINENNQEVDIEKMSELVLNRIQYEGKIKKLSPIDKINELLFKPIFSIAYGLVLVLLFIWYFHTEYTDYIKIVKLETRFNIIDEQQTITLPMNATSYADIRGIIDRAISLLNLRSVDDSQIFLNPDYIELLGIFVQSEVERNEELKSLLQKTNINFKDGINTEELQKLFNNKKEISVVLGLLERGE